MIISDKGKFIFVHVQKNAGITIEEMLKNAFPDATQQYGRHGHVMSALKDMSRKEWNEHYSFSMVRNPWDRMVSWYSMVKGKFDYLPVGQQKQKRPFQSEFWNQVVTQSHDFTSFLHNCTEVVHENGCDKSYAFNQLDYLVDENGKIVVDYIGRFESLEDDLKKVCNELGLVHKGFPKKNKSKHSHYSEYYTSETRALIAKRFERDIDTFQYTFQDS